MPNDALGRRIKEARNRRGLNQTKLARAIRVSRDTVWRMEKGGNVHKDHVLAALRFLGLDEPGLTAAAEPSEDRQALARALLRAYDASPAMAATLDAIAKPHLDDQGTQSRATAPPLDVPVSAGDSRGTRRRVRGRR